MKSVDPDESLCSILKSDVKSVLTFALLIAVLVMSAGCQPADPGPPNMMPEVLGALQIREGKARDAALATACRESADQGSAPAVLMGIPRIEDASLRDAVAEDCAITLDDAGQAEAAANVANLISSESKRDALLARLKGASSGS
jgi:hypothetical protein